MPYLLVIVLFIRYENAFNPKYISALFILCGGTTSFLVNIIYIFVPLTSIY